MWSLMSRQGWDGWFPNQTLSAASCKMYPSNSLIRTALWLHTSLGHASYGKRSIPSKSLPNSRPRTIIWFICGRVRGTAWVPSGFTADLAIEKGFNPPWARQLAQQSVPVFGSKWGNMPLLCYFQSCTNKTIQCCPYLKPGKFSGLLNTTAHGLKWHWNFSRASWIKHPNAKI